MRGLLTLDLGTATGWAHGVIGTVPRCQTAILSSYSRSPGAYFAAYADFLADLITMFQPAELAAEQTVAANYDRSHLTVESLLGLRAVTELVAWRRDLRVTWHAPSTIKLAITGHGHAKKEQVNAEVIRRGCRPDSFNASDAAALWFYRAGQIGAAQELHQVG